MIRFSSLGDIILSTPVIQALRQSFTDLTINYLVHERFSPIVDHFDPPPDNVISLPPAVRASELPAFARNLAEVDYDLVIDLHNSLRSKVIRRYFPRSEFRIYKKSYYKRWLLFYLWVNRFNPEFSVVSEYLCYAGFSTLEGENRPRLSFDIDVAGQICRRFGLDQTYLVCVPGAAWPQKSWLKERYIELFNQQLPDSSEQIVLLGGPQDTICDYIADALGPSKVVNLKGMTDIQEALAVLSRSRLVIGSDTGLVHAGEALDIPAVMILGPTSRETGARTHHPDSRVHEVKLWCRPCSQNGRRLCYRRKQYCLIGISAEQVAESVTSLIGQT
ncbi:MAG: glycosyltransferase family 9 protein [Fidelibacterota bacterium]|nr:MAG: glycosyltransferase family 9 protein [Candidatus Neomarinimicrobiota bacterium]